MTWRVAILALHDHARRRDRPADPRRGRRPGRLPRDGRRDGARHRGRRRRAPTSAPATRRSARSSPAPGTLRDQLRIVAGARDFRLLLVTFVVQALATGCMLAGVDYLATDVLDRKGAATILFVCFVGPALLLTPVWAALGARIGKKRGYLVVLASSSPPARCWPCSPGRRRSAWWSAPSCWSASGTPAARSSRWRCCPTRRRSTRGGPAPTGPASTPASGPPARRSASRSGPGVFALVLALGGYRSSHRRRRRPAGLRADRDHARLLGAAGGADPAQPVSGCVRYSLDADRGRRTTRWSTA